MSDSLDSMGGLLAAVSQETLTDIQASLWLSLHISEVHVGGGGVAPSPYSNTEAPPNMSSRLAQIQMFPLLVQKKLNTYSN